MSRSGETALKDEDIWIMDAVNSFGNIRRVDGKGLFCSKWKCRLVDGKRICLPD
jgi:hypothetical protein